MASHVAQQASVRISSRRDATIPSAAPPEVLGPPQPWKSAMHYPHRVSNIKRLRQFGFRARMKSKKGRAIINRKRRMGRRLTPNGV
jgi:large subunit ribosomal protein L34